MSADAKSAEADTLIGQKVGGYSITRRVGQGGMGIVYEARHERLDERTAVKVLHKELSTDPKVLQRFFNEAKAISVAKHTGIVKVLDFGQIDDGTAYIMMEFLEGESLLGRMERAQKDEKALPLKLVIELGRQVAAALAVIHQKGIVHRDLKPENIFVVPDSLAPMGERVKLLDFGIAKFLDGPVRKTTVGMILGTPLYMSPEQCEGSEDLDAKVDVYALGVMLYELICGHLPFVADTAAALMRQHMFKEPPPLNEQVLGLPEPLIDLIHHMLAKKPPDRPNMADVAVELDQILAETLEQQTGLPASPLRQSSSRRRQISVGGGQSSTDPFAQTMGGPDGAAATDPLAATVGDTGGSRGSLRTPRPRRSGELLVDGGAAEHGELAGAPKPVSTTGMGAPSRRLPLLVAGALTVALVILVAALRFRAPAPTGGSTVVAVTPATENPAASPIKPAAANPPPAAAAVGAGAGDKAAEAEVDEPGDPRDAKGRGKKGKIRGGKKHPGEDAEGKKGSGHAVGHSGKGQGDDPDVWR